MIFEYFQSRWCTQHHQEISRRVSDRLKLKRELPAFTGSFLLGDVIIYTKIISKYKQMSKNTLFLKNNNTEYCGILELIFTKRLGLSGYQEKYFVEYQKTNGTLNVITSGFLLHHTNIY